MGAWHSGLLSHLHDGYLCGEVVRRVTGKTLGQFVREEISLPLKVDFHFGLSAAEQRRCAEIYEAPGCPFMDTVRDPATLLGRCWIPLPLIGHEEDFNTERTAPLKWRHSTVTGRRVVCTAICCSCLWWQT